MVDSMYEDPGPQSGPEGSTHSISHHPRQLEAVMKTYEDFAPKPRRFRLCLHTDPHNDIMSGLMRQARALNGLIDKMILDSPDWDFIDIDLEGMYQAMAQLGNCMCGSIEIPIGLKRKPWWSKICDILQSLRESTKVFRIN